MTTWGTNRWLCGLMVAVWLMVGHGGCSRQPPPADPDTQAVSDLVYNLVDLAQDPARFESQFTPKAAPSPAERRRFGAAFLKLAEPPVVGGDRATLQVEVTQGDRQETVQWTAVRQGGQWKLDAAPLPTAK